MLLRSRRPILATEFYDANLQHRDGQFASEFVGSLPQITDWGIPLNSSAIYLPLPSIECCRLHIKFPSARKPGKLLQEGKK